MNRKKVMAATLVIVLIVGGIIWYNASRNAKDAARYAEGVEALDAGRYTEAMTIFNDLKRRSYRWSLLLYKRLKTNISIALLLHLSLSPLLYDAR